MLTPGRGLRGAALSEMARTGRRRRLGGRGAAWAMSRSAPAPSPPRPNAGRFGSTARPPRSTRSREWLSVLWLTPAMDRLFLGSAGERRRFLDRLVLALEPGHAHHASRYEAAMRARNKLLAEDAGTRPGSASLELRWPSMAPRSPRRASAPSRRSTTGWPARPTTSSPAPRSRSKAGPAATSPPRCAANRARDAAAGRATEGPHRQDLAVLHRAKRMPAARSLDRRAEGPAARPRPRPRRPRHRAPRRAADPAARRSRRPSRSQAPRGAVRPARRARPGVDDGDRSGAVRRHRRGLALPRPAGRIDAGLTRSGLFKLSLYIAPQHEALFQAA